MSLRIPIVGSDPNWVKVSYIGVYNFDKLYRSIVNWFKSKNYFFNEKIHLEAVKSTGKDHKIDFVAIKDLDEYCRLEIKIEIWALRTNKLSEDTYKGEIQIRVQGAMIVDSKNKFEKYGALGKVLRNFYHKYIIKKRLWNKYAGAIYVDANDLIATMKSNLGLITQY